MLQLRKYIQDMCLFPSRKDQINSSEKRAALSQGLVRLCEDVLSITYGYLGSSREIQYADILASGKWHQPTAAYRMYFSTLKRNWEKDENIPLLFWYESENSETVCKTSCAVIAYLAEKRGLLQEKFFRIELYDTAFFAEWIVAKDLKKIVSIFIHVYPSLSLFLLCKPPASSRKEGKKSRREIRKISPVLLRQGLSKCALCSSLGTTLTFLDLSDIGLSHLPKEICLFSALKTCILSDNLLHSLPIEIGSLCKLEILYLRNNKLTELPEELSLLHSLKLLDLAENRIHSVSEKILCLPHLQMIDLSSNRLSISSTFSLHARVIMHGMSTLSLVKRNNIRLHASLF